MSDQTLELDASMFAARMRTHRKREVSAVRPRGETTYLRKHPIAEVWTPNTQQVKITSKKQQPESVITKTSPKRVEEPDIEPIMQQAAPKPLDFAARAEQWQLDKQKTQVEKKGLLTQRLLIGMAVVVFLAGLAVTAQTFMTNKKVVETVAAQPQNNAVAPMEEDEPTDNDLAGYTVAPNMPRLLHIPKYNVKSRIKPVGVDKQNKMQAPTNIHDAGWFKDSALPGSAGGASIIDGHVSGPTKKGVFYRLKDLKPGDTVQVERGDGKLLTYKVIRTKKYDAKNVNMTEAMVSVNQAKHGLNLITCTGEVTNGTNYSERLIVFTELVS